MAKKLAAGDRVETPDGPGTVQGHFYGSASGLPYVRVVFSEPDRECRVFRTREVKRAAGVSSGIEHKENH